MTPPLRRGSSGNGSGGAFRHGVFGAASGLVLPLTSLLTGPLLARALGPDGRGEMSTVLAPVFIVVFIASMGIPEATTWALATLGQKFRDVRRVVVPMLLALGVVATSGVWLLAPILVRQSPQLLGELRTAAFAIPFLMLALGQRFSAAGLGQYRLANLERVTSALLRLIALVGLFSFSVLDVTSAVWTNIGTTLVAGAVLTWRSARARSASRSAATTAAATVTSGPGPRTSRLGRRIAAFGLRGWGGVFGNLVNWRLDQVLLAPIVEARQLGHYVVAVSLAEIPLMAIASVKNIIFAETSRRADARVAALAARVALALTALGALVGIATAGPLIRLLFGSAFEDSTALARILLLGSVAYTTEQSLAAGLLSAGYPGRRSLGQIVAAAGTVVGLTLLVPIFGVTGAAWTSVGAYTLNLAWTLVSFARVTGMSPWDTLRPRADDVRWLGSTVRTLRARRRSRRGA